MNKPWERIPTHDYLGRRVKIGERATIFSPHGTHYDGVVVQRGGKRWLEIDAGMWIGGIGNCYLMKEEQHGREENTDTN